MRRSYSRARLGATARAPRSGSLARRARSRLADARRLEGLFVRCGCQRGFMFRVPGSDKAVVARFEDQLPLRKDGPRWRAGPVLVRQMIEE